MSCQKNTNWTGFKMYCEDYPCCGHTNEDPCGVQPYDAPGYYDTTIRGNEHALCDHENGECDVEYDYDGCPNCGDEDCDGDCGDEVDSWAGSEDAFIDASEA